MYNSEEYFDTFGDTADSYRKKLLLTDYKNVASGFYWTAITPTGDDTISISANDQRMDISTAITVNGELLLADDNPFAYVARIVYFSDGKHGVSDKYDLGNVRCIRKNTQ